jgi:hypothetical protein
MVGRGGGIEIASLTSKPHRVTALPAGLPTQLIDTARRAAFHANSEVFENRMSGMDRAADFHRAQNRLCPTAKQSASAERNQLNRAIRRRNSVLPVALFCARGEIAYNAQFRLVPERPRVRT